MSKKYKRIMEEVAARWKETLTTSATPDLTPAKKLLIGKSKSTRVFVVDTPLQFYVGQAVLRGRLSKTKAKEYCGMLKIDHAFLDELTRVGGTRQMLQSLGWQRSSNNSIMDNMMAEHMKTVWFGKDKDKHEETSGRLRRRWWRQARNSNDSDVTALRTSDLHSLFHPLVGHELVTPSGYRVSMHLNFNSNAVSRSVITIMNAVSNSGADIINDEFDPQRHMYDAVHAEIACRMLNCKDPNIIKHFEVFHYTTAVMQFNDAYMLLGSRPTVHMNAENNLHCETGPAVQWNDGTGMWFLDGHILRERGEQIVLRPETLKAEDINALKNEEERRVAIDRVGWGKFLADNGATVIDRRDNCVDNTIEVLIKQPKRSSERWAPEEPLRMVLACRSTGRKYFIAVPTEFGNERFSDTPATKITNCAEAQQWLADGAVTEHLPYANKPLNIVGAS
jgi:hypothetical protein